MILLYTNDLFLIESKYKQLPLLIDHFKPDYTVLNGNLFTPHPYYNYEKDTLDNIENVLTYISKYTKVICQLGNFDEPDLSNFLNQLGKDNSNIINLTDKIFYYDVINFIGISGVVTDYYNSKWILPDDNNVNSIESKLTMYSVQSDLQKSIILTSVPPIGVGLDTSDNPLNHGSFTLRRFLYHEPISPRIILSSGFPDNFKYTKKYYTVINNCMCVNPSQPMDDFYYCILNIDNNLNVTDIWHPKKFYSEG